MIDSIYLSLGGLQAQQTRLDVVSNNLANVNTSGFKRGRVSFQDLMYQPLNAAQGSTQSPGVADSFLGTGATVARTEQVFSQGDLRQTQRPLDLAIQGQGFFQVELPDGSTAYTRLGQFALNEAGELVTGDGFRLNTSVRVPTDATDIKVSAVGEVTAAVSDDANPVDLGQLDLVNFANPASLRPIGSGLYITTEQSGEPYSGIGGDLGLGTVKQGYLEASNVDFVEELTELEMAQRAYQMNARVLQAADEILSEINSLRR